MGEQLLELLAAGENIGGYLLIWILWEQHKRLNKVEDKLADS